MNTEHPEAPRAETTIRVYRDTGRMIATSARHRDMSIAEFFDAFIRNAVVREYAATIEAAHVEVRHELEALKS